MALGEEVKAALHVAAGYCVERTGEPVAEIQSRISAVALLGAGSAAVVQSDVVLAGLAQCRQRARLGALARRVITCSDAPQEFLSQVPRLVQSDSPRTTHDDALVGRLAPAVANAVVYEEGLGTGGVDAHAKAREIAVREQSECRRNDNRTH
ncbi:MAG: hypothetical protein OXU42_17590 [Deltaproteobacteria bacterium]|nr:hypothetical protein [Deltaproteobacteria bacterium]